jgi:hypothetical protein
VTSGKTAPSLSDDHLQSFAGVGGAANDLVDAVFACPSFDLQHMKVIAIGVLSRTKELADHEIARLWPNG